MTYKDKESLSPCTGRDSILALHFLLCGFSGCHSEQYCSHAGPHKQSRTVGLCVCVRVCKSEEKRVSKRERERELITCASEIFHTVRSGIGCAHTRAHALSLSLSLFSLSFLSLSLSPPPLPPLSLSISLVLFLSFFLFLSLSCAAVSGALFLPRFSEIKPTSF